MRKWVWAGASAGVLGVMGLVLFAASGGARPTAAARGAGEDEPRPAALPLSRVLLFSSGVAHFQREGAVSGDARVDLSFPVSDINDLIKSMTVRDLDGGHVGVVSYDSSAPVERTLKSFAVDLTRNPTLEAILNQARGERVEVVPLAAAGAAGTLSGSVVGVERQKAVVGKDTIDTAVLNLWCADGVRSVKLSEVQRLKFLSPVLESEFRKALETLALSHDTQKKAVAIRCEGEGKRRVQVGYVVESPVWKTSYRLALPGKGGEAKAPYLQGWAVVENSTDEDWKDVRMALISGRPISFQMDLYQPLFVNRPTAQLELFASLRPVAYSGRLDDDKAPDVALADEAAKKADGKPMPPPAAAMAPGMPGGGFGMGGGKGEGRGRADYRRNLEKELKENLDLGRSVTSAATASRLGDFFQYAIDRPVSLPRQKSALLPIVGKDVKADRLSIYNEGVQAKFPLLGVRFRNTTGLHLMQGPVTVFEGGSYAGDAVARDLQPNEERLLSYAVDLACEVNPVVGTDSGRYLTLKAAKGVLHATSKVRRTKTYQVKNRSEDERTLLVEQPVDNNFKLVGEKPRETAADVYRFELKVPAGQKKDLVVTEERDEQHRFEVTSEGDDRIRWFISQPVASEGVKKGLQRAMELRWALQASQREAAELERQLRVITEDQGRLRANIAATPSTAAVYKKYLAKLDAQEEQIEKLQAQIEKHKADTHAKKKSFDDFLASFDSE